MYPRTCHSRDLLGASLLLRSVRACTGSILHSCLALPLGPSLSALMLQNSGVWFASLAPFPGSAAMGYRRAREAADGSYPAPPSPSWPRPGSWPATQPSSSSLPTHSRQLFPVLPTIQFILLCPNQDSSLFSPAQKPLLAPHYPQDQDRPQGPGSCPSCSSPPGPRAWHGVDSTRGCSIKGLSSCCPQPPAWNALSSFPRLSCPSDGEAWRISGGSSCFLQQTLRAGTRPPLSD